jgi:hypothetical protein
VDSAHGVVAINGQLLRYCVMPDLLVIGHRNWLNRASLSIKILNQGIMVRASVVLGWPM